MVRRFKKKLSEKKFTFLIIVKDGIKKFSIMIHWIVQPIEIMREVMIKKRAATKKT